MKDKKETKAKKDTTPVEQLHRGEAPAQTQEAAPPHSQAKNVVEKKTNPASHAPNPIPPSEDLPKAAINETDPETVDKLIALANERDELQRNLKEAVAENERLKQENEELKKQLEDKAEAKVMSKAKDVNAFKQALKGLGLTPKDVLGHHEYSSDSIVIVTKNGKKLLWGKDPGGHVFDNAGGEK